MPIKNAGTFLKLTEIAAEFNDPAPHQMSEFHRGAGRVVDLPTNAAIPASGALRFGQFYGTGNAVTAVALSGTNVDVAPLFPGTFTNTDAKILTIAAPIQITGNNVALTVPSNMGGTLDIQNAGNIIGSRGNGGNAGSGGNGGNASAGGAAISIQSNGVTLNNSGTVSGGGGGGGGGGAGASVTNTSQVNIGAANYSPTRQWYKRFSGGGSFANNNGLLVVPVGTINFSGGSQNTTQLNTASGTGAPAQINRGNPLGDAGDANPHNKRFNVAGGFYSNSSTTPGGNGGGGGNGYGWNGSSIVNPESGSAGSSPGGAAGGAGGAAGAAGSGGSNSPAFSGGSAGAGGNSLTSPGSVNYSVTNLGTINGTQG